MPSAAWRCSITHQVLPFVVRQLDLLELAVDDGGSFELRSWFLDLGSHVCESLHVSEPKRHECESTAN